MEMEKSRVVFPSARYQGTARSFSIFLSFPIAFHFPSIQLLFRLPWLLPCMSNRHIRCAGAIPIAQWAQAAWPEGPNGLPIPRLPRVVWLFGRTLEDWGRRFWDLGLWQLGRHRSVWAHAHIRPRRAWTATWSNHSLSTSASVHSHCNSLTRMRESLHGNVSS